MVDVVTTWSELRDSGVVRECYLHFKRFERERHKDRYAIRAKKYSAENRDKLLKYYKEYNATKRNREYAKEYYRANRDLISLRGKIYRQKYHDEIIARRKIYYDNNQGKNKSKGKGIL